MATITERVFATGSDRAIVLGNEEIVRPLGIGTTWNRIRIGAMLAFTPDGINNILSCSLTMGVCSTASGFSKVNTPNALGATLGNVTAYADCTYTYTAGGSGNPYFLVGGLSHMKRVGATTTELAGAAAGGSSIPTTTGSIQRMIPWYVDILKGSPNYSIHSYQNNTAAQAERTYSLNAFYDGMEQGTTTMTIDGLTWLSSSATAFAFDETAGALTSVFVYWQKSTTPVEIYAWAVTRLS